MGRGHHEHTGIPEVSQGQTERDMPLIFVDRDRTHLSARHETESSCKAGGYHDGGAKPEPQRGGAGL
jgi:hypothetical protein